MGTGIDINTDDFITSAKMNLKLESVANADVDANANIVGSKLALNARRHYAHADAVINLAASAAANIFMVHTFEAGTFRKLGLIYTEASDANTGVPIVVGTTTNANYYYNTASEVNCNAYYIKDATLLQTAIAANAIIVCGTPGGKSGTGQVLVTAEFDVND